MASSAITSLLTLNSGIIPLVPPSSGVVLAEAAVNAGMPHWSPDYALKLMRDKLQYPRAELFMMACRWAPSPRQDNTVAREIVGRHCLEQMWAMSRTVENPDRDGLSDLAGGLEQLAREIRTAERPAREPEMPPVTIELETDPSDNPM